MQNVWESPHFREYLTPNTTTFHPENPMIRVETFCSSMIRRSRGKNGGYVFPNIIAILLLSGHRLHVSEDGAEEYQNPGHFSILNLNLPTGTFQTLSEEDERYFVLFRINPILLDTLQNLFPGGLPAFQASDPQRLRVCFEEIRDALDKPDPDDTRISAAAYRLLAEAACQQPEIRYPAALITALRYIDSHFQEPSLSREQIAREASVSVSTLANLFRLHLQTTIQQTIAEKRMSLVCQKLTFSAAPVAKIAEETGFSYSYYLAREFRKKYGITPMKYRKKTSSNI